MKNIHKTRKVGDRVIAVRPEKPSTSARQCASEPCGQKFTPLRSDQIYCSKRCSTREQQRKLRERARIGVQ